MYSTTDGLLQNLLSDPFPTDKVRTILKLARLYAVQYSILFVQNTMLLNDI